MEEKRIRGVVRWFDFKKGYGFIDDDDGRSFFLHKNRCVNKEPPWEGARVTFVPRMTEKGWAAYDCEPV